MAGTFLVYLRTVIRFTRGRSTVMDEENKYQVTYIAEPTDPFWVCAVKGCQLEFPHMVGITEDRKWKHVWADSYSSSPSTSR